MPWRGKARRGRPRKPNALSKRRAKTTAGRAVDVDLGTNQLRAFKRRIAAGREDLEIGAASVLAHNHIDREQFDKLGEITSWLETMSRAWGGVGGVAGLWFSITGAAVPMGFVPRKDPGLVGLADRARRRLQRTLRRLDGSRNLVIKLASGAVPPIVVRVLEHSLTPEDAIELERLRQGLDAISGEYRRATAM